MYSDHPNDAIAIVCFSHSKDTELDGQLSYCHIQMETLFTMCKVEDMILFYCRITLFQVLPCRQATIHFEHISMASHLLPFLPW